MVVCLPSPKVQNNLFLKNAGKGEFREKGLYLDYVSCRYLWYIANRSKSIQLSCKVYSRIHMFGTQKLVLHKA